MVTVARPPTAIVPRLQVKTGPPVQVPWLGVTAPAVKPGGNVSVSLTAVAADGPALVTVTMYVPVDRPAVTLVTPSVLVTARSASAFTVVSTESVLLPGFGSLVELATVAVLARIVPSGVAGSTVAVMTTSTVSPGDRVPRLTEPVQPAGALGAPPLTSTV